ncbi:alkaline phosphatase family protein [Isoptericola halotolerans]|uniref:Arylsulfatase A-like enzyme n=1 Tax=Isoptericola halotolerans TaxID=300560 RepID=A0ABX2A0M9_9MICO|nr:alkaline phosphatase family protein [Isoptericola halotolerans]NOV95493.1 arylsulfatase A-like enzyme [Isoptericola halotolerans]
MPPDAAPPADHVVLVALDGFDAGYLRLLEDLPTPHLDALARRGSLTTGTGVLPSITNPSWTSIATGAWPAQHRNTAFWYDPSTRTAQGQRREIAVPTLAEAVRQQGGIVFSAQWSVLQDHGVSFGDPDGLYTQPGGDCSRRVDDAVAVLRGEPVVSAGRPVATSRLPRLLAVYCDTLDALGHAGGDRHPGIPAALQEIDTQVGRLVDAVAGAGITDRTAFVLLGDHGMTTFDRGCGRAVRRAIARAGYRAEMLRPGDSPGRRTDVVVVVGGVASLHLVGRAAGDPRALGAVRRAIEALPQVRVVHGKEEQAARHMSPLLGELVAEPEPGWSFGRAPRRPAGRHGASTELEVAFLLAGAGVAPGRPPSGPRHVDVAPTIAALLGIDPPAGCQGRVLTEALAVGGLSP